MELLLIDWRQSHPSGKVIVLPLGGDYFAGGNWRTADAYHAFISVVSSTDYKNDDPHLIIIEDAHEIHVDSGRRYPFHSAERVDLANASLIVSSRPKDIERVCQDIEYWSSCELKRFKTDSGEIAASLVSTAVTSAQDRAEFGQLYGSLGSNLISLAAAICQRNKEQDEPVTIELAFRAVSAELDRVFHPDTVIGQTHDIAQFKCGLLTVWMLGSVEAEFEATDLARLLNQHDVSQLVHFLETSKELFYSTDDMLSCARHPAWGQLVMRAVDQYDRLDLISDRLLGRFLAPAPKVAERKDVDCLTAFLFAVLYQKVMTPAQLGFMSTGRHMHDEFVRAGLLYVEGGEDRSGSISDRLPTLLQIGSGIRRSNPRDFDQRQLLLDQAGYFIDEAIELAERDLGVSDFEDLPGQLLYEIGYLYFLRGDFESAVRAFRSSKLNELREVSRQRFGLMSGVLESVVLTCMGDLRAAKACLDDLIPILDLLEADTKIDRSGFNRFKANYYHARMEIALSERRSTEAISWINDFVAASEEGNQGGHRMLYDARVALLEREYEVARDHAINSMAQSVFGDSVERYYCVHRVLGDAYLGMGLRDSAVDSYRKVLPDRGQEPKYRDAETQIVQNRLVGIANGIEGEAILRSGRV